MINVRDYGAAGNGVTNETTAILNSLAAAVLAGGGSVYFPAGTYLINSFAFNSSLKLVGDGIGRTILQQADTNANFITLAASNITLQDLTVVANSSATTGNGVYANSTISNIFLIRVRVTGASYAGVYIPGAVSNLQVQGAQFDTNSSCQFYYYLPAGDTASRVLLQDSIFDGSATTTGFVSLFIETADGSSGALTDVSIVGNLIYSKNRGATESDGLVFVNNLSNSESCSHIVIANNVIVADTSSSTACYGIEISGCTDVSITGNVIESYYCALLLEHDTGASTLTNNGIASGNTILPNVASGGSSIWVSNGTWIVSNNQIVQGGGTYGIEISASNTVVVGNSVFAPTGGTGISIAANGAIVNDNYITSSGTGGGSYGILFASATMSAIQVRNNYISSLTYGFVFADTTGNTDVVISGTVFNSVSVKYHGGTPTGAIILDDSNAGYFSFNVPTILEAV